MLGFDNLLYISIESKRVPEEKQQFVRRFEIGLAIGLRIALLFIVVSAIESFQEPFLNLENDVVRGWSTYILLSSLSAAGSSLHRGKRTHSHARHSNWSTVARRSARRSSHHVDRHHESRLRLTHSERHCVD